MAQKNEESMPNAPENPLKLEGYSTIGFIPVEESKFDLNNHTDAVRPAFQNVPHLNEEEAKHALAQYVSEHCCYGKGPVNDLVFNTFDSSNTHRYVLQTFTETRSTAYAAEPYHGQPIYITGQPASPWSIPVIPSILFHDEVHKIEIPNTAHVENCTKCFGVGTKVCYSCNGRGTKSCWFCHGSGRSNIGGVSNPSYGSTDHDHHHHGHDHHHHDHHHHDHHHHHQGQGPHCVHCNGTGLTSCDVCHRAGRIQCYCCKGSGKLKWFLQLTVQFKNNEEDFFKRSSVIPEELVRKCQAQNAFSEQNTRIYPVNTYSENEINEASYNLLNSHNLKFSNSKIIAQRQDIYVIPVTLCTYTWKDKVHTFHVFGLDHSVYCPDYPKKCCCTIL